MTGSQVACSLPPPDSCGEVGGPAGGEDHPGDGHG